MPLTSGSQLGVFTITAKIGVGGMGEVYQATDTNLKRQVAIKVLPASVAGDADRLARFQREAEVLAALNHPHIAAIYGLEKTPDGTALVMELVEGDDLSQRIARGAIPIDEALPIAKQIAEALEAAHEQGIIHRDLKPANIKVRRDGTVKVLDFGLAKALDQGSGIGDQGSGSAAHSPTITTPAMTQAGMILGTAAYMAPEQARGKAVDKRADIWAFGVVLFEMLTGRRAFDGEDMTEVLGAVVRLEPQWEVLPSDVPLPVRTLLQSCLVKDPRRRVADISIALFVLDKSAVLANVSVTAPQTTAAATTAAPRRRIVAIASATLLAGAVVAALAMWALTRPTPVTQQPMRFALVPPAVQALAIPGSNRDLVLSADGRHLVYVAGEGQLMVRAIDALDAVPLGGITGRSPFLSPDGRWVGYFASNQIRKVAIAGGPPVTLCSTEGFPRGASWGPDDTIVFATSDSSTGLHRVAAAGGVPTVLTTPDAAQGEGDHLFPSVLPNGRAVLFTLTSSSGGIETAQIAVRDLTTGQTTTLIRGGSQAEYVAPGYLVYAVAGTLRAVRFDPDTLAVGSDPVPVVEAVTTLTTGAAAFSVSRTGTLVYVPGGNDSAAQRSLVWVTRDGREEPIAAAPPRAYALPRLSPDGTWVALDIRDQQNDIWIWDLARLTLTRLDRCARRRSEPGVDAGQPARGLRVGARGCHQSLLASGEQHRDRRAPGHESQPPASDVDLARWHAADRPGIRAQDQYRSAGPNLDPSTTLRAGPSTPLGTPPRQTEPLLQTTSYEDNGEISPDGRWLAFQSSASGRNEIFVRPFPNVDGGNWTISPSGGTRPLWARNGTELFYLDSAGAMTRVPVQTAPTFSAGTATTLFKTRYVVPGVVVGRGYDVSPDGQRFLMIKQAGTAQAPTMVVVLNWLEELKAKLPTK